MHEQRQHELHDIAKRLKAVCLLNCSHVIAQLTQYKEHGFPGLALLQQGFNLAGLFEGDGFWVENELADEVIDKLSVVFNGFVGWERLPLLRLLLVEQQWLIAYLFNLA